MNDYETVHQLNLAAFGNGPEAVIVDKLRATCENYLAFVAVENDIVVGHILFTPITLQGCQLLGMGLAPMAVLPSHQRKGIGSLLVRHAIKHLTEFGCPFIIVLGHPEYYPRFGFEPASNYKLTSQWQDIPDEAFMVLVLNSAALPKSGGVAKYHALFDKAM